MAQLTRTLYNHSILFFVGFSVLVVWGFWRSYFSNPLQIPTTLMHLHGFSMTLWCVMLMTQATLIRTGQRKLHRQIGKASYLLAPVIMVVLTLVSRNVVAEAQLGPDGRLPDSAYFFASLTVLSVISFGILYGAAMVFRKNAPVHGRLMLCTVFPTITAAGDRIISIYFPGFRQSLPVIAGAPAVQVPTWIAADLIVLGLAVWDWRERARINVFPPVLALLFAYHLFTANAHHLGFWRSFTHWFAGV